MISKWVLSVFIISINISWASDVENYELKILNAENGDAESALYLYEIAASSENEIEAKYWLHVASLWGSPYAKLLYAKIYYAASSFDEELSKRRVLSVISEGLNGDNIGEAYYVLGKIAEKNNDDSNRLKYFFYSSYMGSFNGRMELVDACYQVKEYYCLYLWSSVLLGAVEEGSIAHDRLNSYLRDAFKFVDVNKVKKDIKILNRDFQNGVKPINSKRLNEMVAKTAKTRN